MARKKKCAAVPAVRRKSLLPTIPQEPAVELPNGLTLTKGMIVTVKGVDGTFRFQYARHGGQEVTVYGGTGKGDKVFHSWRTFTPDRILTGTVNPIQVTLEKQAAEQLPADWATLTPGFKAAFTRRMNLAKKALVTA